jgi:hypothetical protein
MKFLVEQQPAAGQSGYGSHAGSPVWALRGRFNDLPAAIEYLVDTEGELTFRLFRGEPVQAKDSDQIMEELTTDEPFALAQITDAEFLRRIGLTLDRLHEVNVAVRFEHHRATYRLVRSAQ